MPENEVNHRWFLVEFYLGMFSIWAIVQPGAFS